MPKPPISFANLSDSNIDCTIHLDVLYPDTRDLAAFNERWQDFLTSDEGHGQVIQRDGNTITYPHKSWVPARAGSKPSLLLLFGNPAPHSVVHDVYFAYEGKGTEHRFWKVLRELGFANLHGDDPDIKQKFLTLKYESPFRLGLEVIYTFPTSASKPTWSGVMGMQRLFGRQAMALITAAEKQRLDACVSRFIDHNGAIIALQKDAYNAVADNQYNLKLASEGNLASSYLGVPVYGLPPTRWLYTAKMKGLLSAVKDRLLHAQEN